MEGNKPPSLVDSIKRVAIIAALVLLAVTVVTAALMAWSTRPWVDDLKIEVIVVILAAAPFYFWGVRNSWRRRILKPHQQWKARVVPDRLHLMSPQMFHKICHRLPDPPMADVISNLESVDSSEDIDVYMNHAGDESGGDDTDTEESGDQAKPLFGQLVPVTDDDTQEVDVRVHVEKHVQPNPTPEQEELLQEGYTIPYAARHDLVFLIRRIWFPGIVGLLALILALWAPWFNLATPEFWAEVPWWAGRKGLLLVVLPLCCVGGWALALEWMYSFIVITPYKFILMRELHPMLHFYGNYFHDPSISRIITCRPVYSPYSMIFTTGGIHADTMSDDDYMFRPVHHVPCHEEASILLDQLMQQRRSKR